MDATRSSQDSGPGIELQDSQRTFKREPEEALMLAVLEDAIACYQKHMFAKDKRGREIFLDTEAWMLEKDGHWIFSFENICETLSLDPNYLRQGLLRLKEQSMSKAKIHPLIPRRRIGGPHGGSVETSLADCDIKNPGFRKSA